MYLVSILFVVAAVMLRCSSSYPQTNSIVFANNNGATSSPQTDGCRCVSAGTCIRTPSGPGFDVRIVNPGANGCSFGQEWCCGTTADLTLSASCGIRKITNSTAQPTGTTKYGAYPWQAALLTRDNSYIGSGVLLNANYVLTAAHKIATMNGNFVVRLGEWDGQNTNEPYPYQNYAPAQVTIHPSFNSMNLQNDLAIVRLDKSVQISSSPSINNACLGSAVPAAGTRCWVSGWGKNAFGANGNYQSIMREVDVPMVDRNDCETRLRGTRLGQYFQLDGTSFVCAGGETGKDACTGDGGAPLVCQSSESQQWRVIGLVAWGIGCAGSGIPGVYVNVPNFRTWITQQTGVSSSP